MTTPIPDADRADLTRFLAERDAPCPGCGYSLRGLTGTRCPECNQELKLRVGLAEPRLAWFVAGVAGLAMGAGFGLLLFGIFVLFLASRNRGRSPLEAWPMLATGVVCAALLWGWVRARRWLNDKPAPVRWAMATATFVVSAAMALVCFLIVG